MEKFVLEFNTIYEDFKNEMEKQQKQQKQEKEERDQKVNAISRTIVELLGAIESLHDRNTTYRTNIQEIHNNSFTKDGNYWEICITPSSGKLVKFKIEKEDVVSNIENYRERSIQEIIQKLILEKFKENIRYSE